MEPKELILAIQEIEDFVWRHNTNFITNFASTDTVEILSLSFNSTHAKFLCKKENGTVSQDQTTMPLLFKWVDKFKGRTYV